MWYTVECIWNTISLQSFENLDNKWTDIQHTLLDWCTFPGRRKIAIHAILYKPTYHIHLKGCVKTNATSWREWLAGWEKQDGSCLFIFSHIHQSTKKISSCHFPGHAILSAWVRGDIACTPGTGHSTIQYLWITIKKRFVNYNLPFYISRTSKYYN